MEKIPNSDCKFCKDHNKGDTLYEQKGYEFGIGFEYIENIRFCPICGAKLQD